MLQITCPKCGDPNDSTERFCGGCGSELNNATAAALPPADASQTPPPLSPVPVVVVPASPTVASPGALQFYLNKGGVSFALSPGETKTVGRKGSGADVEIDDESVSLTPFAVIWKIGQPKPRVEDRGSSHGTRVVTLLRADIPERTSAPVDKGDAIVAGKGLLFDIK